VQMAMSRLYQAAVRAVEEGSLPGAASDRLLRVLGDVTARTAGLPMTGGVARRHLTYQHIAEKTGVISMGIFLIPPFASIPLHDHPEMSVVSRVLAGSVRVRSFDWVEGAAIDGVPRRAMMCDDVVARAGDSRVLHPNAGGNVHEFTAESEGAAIIDVLAPPYDHLAGSRSCSYYDCEDIDAAEEGCTVWLRCVAEPSDFVIDHEPYSGELANE